MPKEKEVGALAKNFLLELQFFFFSTYKVI